MGCQVILIIMECQSTIVFMATLGITPQVCCHTLSKNGSIWRCILNLVKVICLSFFSWFMWRLWSLAAEVQSAHRDTGLVLKTIWHINSVEARKERMPSSVVLFSVEKCGRMQIRLLFYLGLHDIFKTSIFLYIFLVAVYLTNFTLKNTFRELVVTDGVSEAKSYKP